MTPCFTLSSVRAPFQLIYPIDSCAKLPMMYNIVIDLSRTAGFEPGHDDALHISHVFTWVGHVLLKCEVGAE